MKIVFNCKGLAEELKERVLYCSLFSVLEYFACKEEQEDKFFEDVKSIFGDFLMNIQACLRIKPSILEILRKEILKN